MALKRDLQTDAYPLNDKAEEPRSVGERGDDSTASYESTTPEMRISFPLTSCSSTNTSAFSQEVGGGGGSCLQEYDNRWSLVSQELGWTIPSQALHRELWIKLATLLFKQVKQIQMKQ